MDIKSSRRQFLKSLGMGTAALGSLAIAPRVLAKNKAKYQWKMVTTWPKNFPGVGTGANYLAQLIEAATEGQIHVKVYGAGEMVPSLGCFDAVSRGAAQMGHGAAYYWRGKAEAAQFFGSVPFGMTFNELNSWLLYDEGLKLWQELYANFNLYPMPGGNTGTQMAGWFKKPIYSLQDMKGLKMRIPGLGAEVIKHIGVVPVLLPGNELFTSMQKGVIDATEWVGPYNDLAFGLHKVAKNYYYPGWQEPGSAIEVIFNKSELESLPKSLQENVKQACLVANQAMHADYMSKNHVALQTLKNEHKINIQRLPKDILKALKVASEEVLQGITSRDKYSQTVFDSYRKFQKQVTAWQDVSEFSYIDIRTI